MIFFVGCVLAALALAYTPKLWLLSVLVLLIGYVVLQHKRNLERSRQSDGHGYTPELTALILSKYQAGHSLREIAELSGKSVASIRAKLVHLKEYNKYGMLGGPKRQAGLPPIPLIVGEESYTKLINYLQENNYSRVSSVICQGNYAIKGGIIDVWLFGDKQPTRLDYFDERLEMIQQFDLSSGSTIDKGVRSGLAASLNR